MKLDPYPALYAKINSKQTECLIRKSNKYKNLRGKPQGYVNRYDLGFGNGFGYVTSKP